MMTERPDVERLDIVHDHEGKPRLVRRDHAGLDLTRVTQPLLLPGGVRDLENVIARYWTSLARWRAATLDLEASGIDLGECRELLANLPGTGDPDDLTSIDWHEVGLRLVNLRPFCGYGELARLHALLTSDDPHQHADKHEPMHQLLMPGQREAELRLAYDPEFDNCAGSPGCGDQRVLFRWNAVDQACCPLCYVNVYGGEPDPALIVTVPVTAPVDGEGSDVD